MTQRTTEQTIQWYRTHETTAQIGFNPNGMCLKVCRTARNIGAMFPSAISAQHATPSERRVYDLSKITKGMIGFSDDPNDSNPYGHVYTFVGRRKGFDRDDPDGLLTRTNSVISGRVSVVPLSFYARNWGDKFQFAATWLNGVVLDLPDRKPEPRPPLPPRGVKRLERVEDILTDMIEAHRKKGHTRLVKALRRDREEIRQTKNRYGKRR